MLVGTKLDLVHQNAGRRKVPKERAKKFAEDNGLLFEETSSVAAKNVNEAFENLL
jgi:GTPase SAR1 family protein